MNKHKEGRPEWFERLEQEDAFPGRTFTADTMDRIERRALSGQAIRRSWRLRFGALGAVACVVGLAIWLVAAGPLAGGGGSDKTPLGVTDVPFPSGLPTPPTSTEPLPTPAPSPSPEVKTVYFLKGPVQALPESQPYASRSIFEGNTTNTYGVAEIAGEYVKIVNDAGEAGWIPSWYLVGEGDTGERVQPVDETYDMIVDKPVTYRLYPGEPEPSGFELWSGKVVHVVREYEGWVEIIVVTYDSPYVENKWVRKDELIPYDETKAKEGLVFRKEMKGNIVPKFILYDETGKETQELPALTRVYIQGEKNGRYWITAGGGLSGYLDKKDFIPNPFIFKVIDQSGEAEATQ
ncbi:hypothetical protein [Cohnella yongneupensis]|uniref:SH3 domain-containing protein n=1 Tax=Cohnella yongneupensis TaxID=425006 RepID=A0ABW0QZ44_9BACL